MPPCQCQMRRARAGTSSRQPEPGGGAPCVCLRIDGDVPHEQNMAALRAFKAYSGPGRCCLLSTVHSGGVGLNIVEASEDMTDDEEAEQAAAMS